MAESADGYEAYYAGKLWSLLPEIYRALDATSPLDPSVPALPDGPLREIVNRIGAQAAILRRSIDRMWEDQSIESCDDWVIPYIGAQLATNLVSGQDPRAQRLDVFNTIYYRQRKGTIPLLEELAWDVAGWDARVVEMWRRLGRARHGLDPDFGLPAGVATWRANAGMQSSLLVTSGVIGANTGTPIGGSADLRNAYGASRTRTAFDEFSHTADMRSSRMVQHSEHWRLPLAAAERDGTRRDTGRRRRAATSSRSIRPGATFHCSPHRCAPMTGTGRRGPSTNYLRRSMIAC